MPTLHTRHDRSRRLIAALITALLVTTLSAPALARGVAHETGQRGQAHGRTAPGLGAELAQVRGATARYHDVDVALADGFAPPPDGHCVDSPAGAMGHHYVNADRIGQLDPTLPQVLLYIPDDDGRLRLVGVEYLSPTGGELFGQPLADDSPPFGPATALHVWLWQANPAGMFASFNPNLSCPPADLDPTD